MITIEIYDEDAVGQDSSGVWPTKKICISSSWLEQYARSDTQCHSAKELLENYTLDEVTGLEERAREADAIQ